MTECFNEVIQLSTATCRFRQSEEDSTCTVGPEASWQTVDTHSSQRRRSSQPSLCSIESHRRLSFYPYMITDMADMTDNTDMTDMNDMTDIVDTAAMTDMT